MKSPVFLLFFVLGLGTINAQCSIEANIEHLVNQWIYLHYLDDNLDYRTDSAQSKNGRFVFQIKVTEPTRAEIYSADKKLEDEFFFQKGFTSLRGDASVSKKCVAAGGSSTADFNDYQRVDGPHKIIRDSLVGKSFLERKAGDTVSALKTQAEFNRELAASRQIQNQYFASHPNSPVSTFILSLYYQSPDARAKGDSLMALMTEANQLSKYGRYRKLKVTKQMKHEPGNPVTHFSQQSISGKEVSTESYKGKYLLIDFWASWCMPCRMESPYLVSAYEKYSSKGFEILGVSLDESKAKWKKAINADKLNWTQVSDLKGWENAAAKLYSVEGIPTNFLIDKNGMIIGKNLRGYELAGKLKQIFGE
jgi:peroxiredoxin